VWERGTGRWDRRWARASHELCLACAPDGSGLALARAGALVWQGLGAAAPVQEWQLPEFSILTGLAFSPDGRELAARGDSPAGDHLLTWDVQAGRPAAVDVVPPHRPRAVAFTSDGRYIVSGGLDRALSFWDRKTGKLAARLDWHVGAVLCLAFSPDGAVLATGSADGTVKLWPWRRLLEGR
jgi:WD40 repeat protein